MEKYNYKRHAIYSVLSYIILYLVACFVEWEIINIVQRMSDSIWFRLGILLTLSIVQPFVTLLMFEQDGRK